MRVWDVYFDLVGDRKPCFIKWYVFVQKVEKAVFRHVQYFKVISAKTKASDLIIIPKRCNSNPLQRPVTLVNTSRETNNFISQLSQEK
jgi:hypothetical protein